MRAAKGGVPEQAEIYLQLIHFEKVWYYGQFRPAQGPLLFGTAHGREDEERGGGGQGGGGGGGA